MSSKLKYIKQKYLNKRFAKLLVIDIVKSSKRNVAKCLCDCGNITTKNFYDLSSGDTKSCGCLRRENSSIMRRDNLLNLKFGKLTVVKYIGSCKKGALWQCLCECGNSHEVATEFLKNGSSKSCGCINRCRGENHYNFDPSISNEDRLNKRGVVKNPLYTKWREDCLLRDNFTCQLSNQKGGDLCVHHIYSWNSHKQLRFDINNGITLSKLVHDKFHKIYGKGDNNMDQFVDYIKTYYTDFDLEKFLSRSINECKSCEG